MTDLWLLPWLYDRQNDKPVFPTQMEWQTCHYCHDWIDRPVITVMIEWQTEWQACLSCPDGMSDLSLLPGLNDRLVTTTTIIWQTEWQSCHSCHNWMTHLSLLPWLYDRHNDHPVIPAQLYLQACHWHSQASMTELWLNTVAMNNIPVKSTGLYTQWP